MTRDIIIWWQAVQCGLPQERDFVCGVPDGAVLDRGGGDELPGVHECACRDVLPAEDEHAADELAVPLVRSAADAAACQTAVRAFLWH